MENYNSTSSSSESVNKRRITIIDYYRGIALIYMAVYHFLFDMAYIFPTEWGKAAYHANDDFIVFDTASFCTCPAPVYAPFLELTIDDPL